MATLVHARAEEVDRVGERSREVERGEDSWREVRVGVWARGRNKLERCTNG